MIQEILDYLLIKNELLTLSIEDILSKLDDEQLLEKYCRLISKMSKEEDFLYTNDGLIEKVQSIIHEKRFSCKHSKEIVDNMNELLDYVHNYKKLTNDEKILIRQKWLKEEKENRKLPLRNLPGFYRISDIYDLITKDYECLIRLSPENFFSPFIKLHQLSTINWVCTKYPKFFFHNPDFVTTAILLCSIIEEDNDIYRKINQETKKRLEDIRSDSIEELKKGIQKKLI